MLLRRALGVSSLVASAGALSSARAPMASSSPQQLCVVDPFCLRQFDASSGKTPHIPIGVESFEAQLNARVAESDLVDGYAPFCKHLFVENFAGCEANVLEITPQNEHLLRTGYAARTDSELPVLQRWFPRDALGEALPTATVLDVILYSRDQIVKENAARGEPTQQTDAPWGVVSVKAQDARHELPMQPITMMRNALGKEHGGSGVPLEADKYRASVAYWARYAPIQ